MLHRFERPQSIAEAARLLASGPWAVLAGGTDLYPAHVGRRIAAPLLDITAIAGLRGIRRDEQGWTIGATTTWSDVVRAELPPLFDALKAAAREVGGVQIQNAGTVAGNLCNASPAADGTDGRIAEAGVAVGSCSAVARRLTTLEGRLVGAAADGDLAGQLELGDLAPLTPIDDLRGSAAYRRDATATLVRRALREVLAP